MQPQDDKCCIDDGGIPYAAKEECRDASPLLPDVADFVAQCQTVVITAQRCSAQRSWSKTAGVVN